MLFALTHSKIPYSVNTFVIESSLVVTEDTPLFNTTTHQMDLLQ